MTPEKDSVELEIADELSMTHLYEAIVLSPVLNPELLNWIVTERLARRQAEARELALIISNANFAGVIVRLQEQVKELDREIVRLRAIFENPKKEE
jgi:hypothetical protein